MVGMAWWAWRGEYGVVGVVWWACLLVVAVRLEQS